MKSLIAIVVIAILGAVAIFKLASGTLTESEKDDTQ